MMPLFSFLTYSCWKNCRGGSQRLHCRSSECRDFWSFRGFEQTFFASHLLPPPPPSSWVWCSVICAQDTWKKIIFIQRGSSNCLCLTEHLLLQCPSLRLLAFRKLNLLKYTLPDHASSFFQPKCSPTNDMY